MNCKEAQELFGIIPDLSEHDPQRKLLEWHVLGCESCAAEYHIWLESMETVTSLPIEISEEQAEAVNRRVMDRIYAESPWLAPDVRDTSHTKRIRLRATIWASCFLAIFICSAILFMVGGSMKENKEVQSMTGILPAAVATTDSEMSSDYSFVLPMDSRGIVDPLVVQLGPKYPQYWMFLSTAGMILGFVSWRGIRRYRR